MVDQFDYRLLARGVDPIKLDNPLDNNAETPAEQLRENETI